MLTSRDEAGTGFKVSIPTMTGPIEDKHLPFLVAEETGKDHGSIRSLEGGPVTRYH